jgi:hypothetical protein
MSAESKPSDLLRTFTPPQELARSLPRDVQLTGGGRALVVCIWLLAAGAIVSGVALDREARRQASAARTLVERGLDTDATVDRLWRTKGENKRSMAAYHFDAGGRRVEGQTRMSSAAWRDLQVGSSLAVRFLPDDPQRHSIAGARRSGMPLWVPWLVGGLLALGAWGAALGLRYQTRLLRDGRPAPAVVTAHQKHNTGHGVHRSMTYEFPLVGGGVARGKASTSSKPPAIGSVITVVYNPDRPGRNRPYPFSLVTPRVD